MKRLGGWDLLRVLLTVLLLVVCAAGTAVLFVKGIRP